jgi:hypothetical protein
MAILWNLLSSFAGGLFGSGAIWAFLNYRQRAKEVELSSAVSISELQRDLANKLLELISESEEYSDVRDGKSEASIPENKLMQLYAHIEILQSDVLSCEARLAKLEDRPPREINVEYIRPEPPRDIRITIK